MAFAIKGGRSVQPSVFVADSILAPLSKRFLIAEMSFPRRASHRSPLILNNLPLPEKIATFTNALWIGRTLSICLTFFVMSWYYTWNDMSKDLISIGQVPSLSCLVSRLVSQLTCHGCQVEFGQDLPNCCMVLSKLQYWFVNVVIRICQS